MTATATPSIRRGRPSALSCDQVGTVYPLQGLIGTEYGGEGRARSTHFSFTSVSHTLSDTNAYSSQQIYTFPAGVITIDGGAGSMYFTTTSAIASTLNSGVTVQWAVGSAAASATTLATTMINMIPGSGQTVPTFTSSTTINVAPAVANAYFKGPGTINLNILDGTATSNKAYLNFAIGTATDIDADATLSITGDIVLHWTLQGDY